MRIQRLLPLLGLVAVGCGNGDSGSSSTGGSAVAVQPGGGSKKGGDLSTFEGVLDAQISSMEDFTVALEGITDKKSAEAAKPKLQAIVKRMQEVVAAGEKLGEPTDDEQRSHEAKLEAATAKLDPRMEKVMERLQGDPEAMMVVASVMAELGSMGR
ncbi:MAG: hypothetical protein ACHQ1G_11640 [Planctomycetota bacterium]